MRISDFFLRPHDVANQHAVRADSPPRRAASLAEADLRVAQIATAQHGLATREQLKEAGLTRRAIAWRLEKGRLHEMLPDVFAVGHEALGDLGRGEAALLAGGEESMTTGGFGAASWELMEFPAVVDLLAPRDGRRFERSSKAARVEVEVHRPVSMPKAVMRHGLRTAMVPQVLLDLALGVPRDVLVSALEQAYVDRRTSTPQLEAYLAARPGHRGTRRLADLVAGPKTRSKLERKFYSHLKAARLPSCETDVIVNGHRVDFAWPEQKVIVETDGWGPHGSRLAFERDRSRDLDHAAAGWTVIRITARMLERQAARIIAVLGAALLDPC